jgi:hypothetical protein
MACVERITRPLFEDEYLLLHATSNPTEIRTATPKIDMNLVRILLSISCKQTAAIPGRPEPGPNPL